MVMSSTLRQASHGCGITVMQLLSQPFLGPGNIMNCDYMQLQSQHPAVKTLKRKVLVGALMQSHRNSRNKQQMIPFLFLN